MKFRCYISFLCILSLACVFMVGCEKMEKPVMDAMDMAMTDTEPETPTEMDDTQQPETPAEMDDDGMPAEMDEGETPAEMDADVILSISPTKIALPEVGEQFTVTASIDSKVAVAGYQFDLTFDTTVLKFVEGSISNYLPENEAVTFKELKADGGSIKIQAVSPFSTSIGEGELASVTFEVIEKKASTIVLSGVQVADAAATLLDFTISEDTVVIQ